MFYLIIYTFQHNNILQILNLELFFSSSKPIA